MDIGNDSDNGHGIAECDSLAIYQSIVEGLKSMKFICGGRHKIADVKVIVSMYRGKSYVAEITLLPVFSESGQKMEDRFEIWYKFKTK